MKTKICSKCKTEKSINDFYKDKTKKDGRASKCNLCKFTYMKQYRGSDSYKLKNRINAKIYCDGNKEKAKNANKKYYQENKEKLNDLHKKYINKKLLSDSFFKLKHNIRTAIINSFRYRTFNKKNKTLKILGCSFEDFKLHLESKFEPWMSWSNYGLYNGEKNFGWDIDHIIPLSIANTEEEVIKLNHYTNLQPLCSYINRVVKKNNH